MAPIFLDLAIFLILLYNIRSGYKRGFIMSLAGVVGLVCGIYGGSLAADHFSSAVSGFMVEPIQQAIESVIDSEAEEAVKDPASSAVVLAGVAKKLKLPEDILMKASQNKSLDGIVGSFAERLAEVVADELAKVIVFAVAFILIEIAVFFLMRILDTILKLPIIGLPNRVGGAVFGALKGGLFVVIGLWTIMYLLPTLTKSGPILSQETIDQSYIVKIVEDKIDYLI